jgi:hypothetical protein
MLFTDPSRRFSVKFPKDWHWMMVSGSGEPIATFVQPKNEAAVIVERFQMKQRLGPADITQTFGDAEADRIKELQPYATGIVARLTTRQGNPVIIIDYERPGIDNRSTERVRQYSYPVSGDLYRITCATLDGNFAKYEPTFIGIAESLTSADQLGLAPQ